MTAQQEAALMRDIGAAYDDAAATFRELMAYAQAPELRARIVGEMDQAARRVAVVMMAGGDLEEASAAIVELLNDGKSGSSN